MTFWETGGGVLLIIVAQCLVVTVAILVSLALLLYMDRKVWAAVQLRRGPNVVGPWGLFQSFADLMKFAFKEPIIHILRFRAGKVCEHWRVENELGMVK